MVLVGTNIVYIIWADGKQQWWDDVRQHGYPDNWKHETLIPSEDKIKPEHVNLNSEKEEHLVL